MSPGSAEAQSAARNAPRCPGAAHCPLPAGPCGHVLPGSEMREKQGCSTKLPGPQSEALSLILQNPPSTVLSLLLGVRGRVRLWATGMVLFLLLLASSPASRPQAQRLLLSGLLCRLLTGGWLTRYRHNSPMYWNTVTPCFWQSSQNWLAENLGLSTTVAPARKEREGQQLTLSTSAPWERPVLRMVDELGGGDPRL